MTKGSNRGQIRAAAGSGADPDLSPCIRRDDSPHMNQPGQKQVGYLEATAIGIGGMVGGGIFAVLGLSVDVWGRTCITR